MAIHAFARCLLWGFSWDLLFPFRRANPFTIDRVLEIGPVSLLVVDRSPTSDRNASQKSSQTETFKYEYCSSLTMRGENPISRITTAMLIPTLLILMACTNHEVPKAIELSDDFCSSIITVSTDGHYLLNWARVNSENIDHVNRCLKSLGINNVRVSKNISDLFPFDSHT